MTEPTDAMIQAGIVALNKHITEDGFRGYCDLDIVVAIFNAMMAARVPPDLSLPGSSLRDEITNAVFNAMGPRPIVGRLWWAGEVVDLRPDGKTEPPA